MTHIHDNETIWQGDYKIPWNDPDFSARMLEEHLSQDHDLASRRTGWVDRQVDWIHQRMLGGQPSSVLDLGCGPGLYAHRLARLGHRVQGIDLGPASVDYARRHNPDPSRCSFRLGDLRTVELPGPADLAMVLYGELNVFSPEEATSLLEKVAGALSPGGRLIVEVQTFESVKRSGQADPVRRRMPPGLFSDRPHECLTVSRWLPNQQAAVQVFTITEDDRPAWTCRSTTRAWTTDQLADLLGAAGLHEVTRRDDWPGNAEDLVLYEAATGDDVTR